MSDTGNNPRLMFFLGAGASVPADVKGVVGLVGEYKEWLTSNNKSDDKSIVEEIEKTLRKWLDRQNIDREVDIELLLETIERIENAKNDILLDFYDNAKPILPHLKDDSSLSAGIKQCIRERCFVPEHKTRYLKPLSDFLNSYNTLDIFSTNYDNSIEQFCLSNEIRCEVGYDTIGWNPSVYKELSNGIKVYKIHGSITSWKTEQEDYNNLPIKDISDKIELSSGKIAEPAIVYPGKKLEYSEPIFDTLVELKQHLRIVRYVFIIGYSFKDEHITRLFQYAAKKNRRLIVILITPSAYTIYDKELKYYKTEPNSNLHTSEMEGRVICLPYTIEKILPILKARFLDNLIQGEQLDIQSARASENPYWNERLKCYTDCEYITRADEIINAHPNWNRILLDDWEFAFKISLKILLNRLLSTDTQSRDRWRNFFTQALSRFSTFDRFIFTPSLGMQTPSFPPEITLEFRDAGRNITARNLERFLRGDVIPLIEDQLRLMNDQTNNPTVVEFLETVNVFLHKIDRFSDYLNLWSEHMSFQQYLERRRTNYNEECNRLMERFRDFERIRQNEEGQTGVREILQQIERREISAIFDGDTLESM